MDDSSQPPPDLAERNRRTLEANGMNAELYFTFHDEQVIRIKHPEDGHFYGKTAEKAPRFSEGDESAVEQSEGL